MRKLIYIVVLCFTGSCSAQNDCETLLHELSDETQLEIFCNQQSYVIDSRGFISKDSFVKNLFCNKGCFSPSSTLEDYFGASDLQRAGIDYTHIPAVLEMYDLLDPENHSGSYSSSLSFFFECLNSDEQIINSCYIYNIFFMIEKDLRLSVDFDPIYFNSLKSIYNFYISFNPLLSDMALNTIRKYRTEESEEFLQGKSFKSEVFNSDEAIQAHKDIKDYSFEGFVKS